jgi:hypothetical protein
MQRGLVTLAMVAALSSAAAWSQENVTDSVPAATTQRLVVFEDFSNPT